METRRTRTGRAEWEKRVERWKDSGLSAEEFAAELGIKPGTLRFWKYSFDKEARTGSVTASSRKRSPVPRRSFVELDSTITAPASPSNAFELELGAQRRLRIPAQFDAESLVKLLHILERK